MQPNENIGLIHKAKRFYREVYGMNHYPALSVLLRGRTRILCYHGFLGDGNFGDELVFEAAKLLFPSYLLVPIKRRMPIFTRFLLRIRCLVPRGEILGGGTLIGSEVDLDESFSMVFIHGTGVRESYADRWVEIFQQRECFGGVRGHESRALLEAKGFPVEIIGDAAFLLLKGGGQPVSEHGPILVNLGTHSANERMRSSRKQMEAFIAEMIERGRPVEYLPLHAHDVSIGEALVRQFPSIRLHSIPVGFDAASEIFCRASFAVGERLHFAVMALLSGCPFFSVMYEPKHEDLLESLGCRDCGALPDEISKTMLLERFVAKHEFDWPRIHKRISEYRQKQKDQASKFLSHIESVP